MSCELQHLAGGGWSEKVLHSFNGGTGDGSLPIGGLIFDKKGNLYGTTVDAGANNGGTVLKWFRAQAVGI